MNSSCRSPAPGSLQRVPDRHGSAQRDLVPAPNQRQILGHMEGRVRDTRVEVDAEMEPAVTDDHFLVGEEL